MAQALATGSPEPLEPLSWHEANQRHLYAALEVVRLRVLVAHAVSLRASVERSRELAASLDMAERAARAAVLRVSGTPALEALGEMFELSGFERDVLLLAAGPKLNTSFGALPERPEQPLQPSFELAFRALKGPFWGALAPSAPLRRHHLIELERPSDVVQSVLRVDERILFFLLGVPTLDARLAGMLEPVTDREQELPAAHERLLRQLAAAWSDDVATVVQLCGVDPEGKRAVAARASAARGLRLYALSDGDVPREHSQREPFARLLDRELMLGSAALLIEADADESGEGQAFRWLIARLTMPVLIARRDPVAGLARREARLEFEALEPDDQRQLWRTCLGVAAGEQEESSIDRLVSTFQFGPSAIRATAAAASGSGPARDEALWESCRRRGRSRLSDIAQRIESTAGWGSLVLPDAQRQVLTQIVAQLSHRALVHERWGFRQLGKRGLGLTALFAGDSGTGKTLAAEVIANQVRLDLWRIDLSRVLDKYIGETEKNLRRVFDSAEESGAILLFDEADALFSKRTEVKDNVDRFTNMEVSYLLQRMEAYGGLAILTTNLRSAIDAAFLRRIRFVVQFPFPRAEQRALIWERSFPERMPRNGIQVARLAQLNVAGGSIRNIALNAAFLAAAEHAAVGMDHLLRAARTECTKLDRTLTDAEVSGWT